MLWLKACPRCNTGDLYEDGDIYGRYIACIQCGHYLTEAEEVVLRYASRTKPTERAEKEVTKEGVAAGRVQ